MLKISEFAKLGRTTRRALIFYDQQGIFKPAQVTAQGYRYYSYDQLYELNFILALRKMGLSLAKIQQLQRQPTTIDVDDSLTELAQQVDQQIEDLVAVKNTLHQRLKNKQSVSLQVKPYHHHNQVANFWQSAILNECSRQQLAQKFADFYQQLGLLTVANGGCSGFVTILPTAEQTVYSQAPCRLIKEVATSKEKLPLTQIIRPAGDYLAVDVPKGASDLAIQTGLQQLHQAIKREHLQVAPELWQVNLTADIRTSAATSETIQLEYLIIDQD